MKIKDYYLSLLSENKDFMYLDNQTIGKINDVVINKADDYIKIDFETSYGKKANLVAEYSKFKHWFSQNVNKFKDSFKSFVEEYIRSSQEEKAAESVNEIVDDDGNIMPSTDKPNNATNTMVGANNRWDLEKVYKSSIPKSIRFYSGNLGIGLITWLIILTINIIPLVY